MKKKMIIIVLLVVLIISGYFIYNYLRIKYAKIEVTLKDNLEVPFLEDAKVSDFIENINGKIIDDYEIDTTKLGNKEISFKFINDDNIKVSYTYNIKVVDVTKPTIWLGNNYNVAVNSDIDLTKKILCGDDYDNSPKCYIEGEYNLGEVGTYPLVFKAVDSSGNTEEVSFNLNVYEPKQTTTNKEKVYTYFNDVVANYKNSNNKIGIDISSHQGDIDFSKLKEAGVEFVMIRVGYGYDNQNYLDKKFEEYIKSANENDIDVGVYYYSYANSSSEAKKQAKWVLKQIKKYKVTLPVVFDWEEWSNFNEYNLSFFGLTSLADDFLSIIKSNGYDGMLYGSKNYLENIWMNPKHDIWLAQYAKEVSYQGEYKMWQLCENGYVDGIDGYVDIDILTTSN